MKPGEWPARASSPEQIARVQCTQTTRWALAYSARTASESQDIPLIRYPLAGAASLTLILASFFIVGGTFRAIGAGMLKFPRWRWSVFSGIISLALGIMLLAQMPVSSVRFIGFAISVDLICDGASLIGLATAIHSLPEVALGKAA